MEQGKLSWIPDSHTFVEKQQIWASVNGAAAVQQGADLGSYIDTATLQFETGASVQLYIRTIGDNGTADNSDTLSFVAANEEKVGHATGLSWLWEKHID